MDYKTRGSGSKIQRMVWDFQTKVKISDLVGYVEEEESKAFKVREMDRGM